MLDATLLLLWSGQATKHKQQPNEQRGGQDETSIPSCILYHVFHTFPVQMFGHDMPSMTFVTSGYTYEGSPISLRPTNENRHLQLNQYFISQHNLPLSNTFGPTVFELAS